MGKRRKPVKKQNPKINPNKIWRDLLVLFIISFFISTALTIYLFNWTDDFFSRMFWTLLVLFLLISVTVLGIVPLVNKLVNRWLK